MASIRQITQKIKGMFHEPHMPAQKVGEGLQTKTLVKNDKVHPEDFYSKNSRKVLSDREERILSGFWSI